MNISLTSTVSMSELEQLKVDVASLRTQHRQWEKAAKVLRIKSRILANQIAEVDAIILELEAS